MKKEWFTAREILKYLNITPQTLYNWRKQNKIEFRKISQKSYLYNINSILGNRNPNRKNVIYCRVSTTKQKDDLIRQEEILRDYCGHHGIIIDKVYKDIASGMNSNRTGLNQLIERIANYEIDKIFITYKDRLTRFGYEYFEKWFNLFGSQIITINATTESTFENELVQDLISIIHYFSMKMYSNRRRELRRIQRELEKIDNN